MKNDLETSLRSLEEATAIDDRSSGPLDAETASLREAWLAFGEMLEAAEPPGFSSPRLAEGQVGMKAAYTRWRRQSLLAAGVLAASLLVAVATICMLSVANRQNKPVETPQQMIANNHKAAPSQKARAKSVSTTDEPKWDDSLDDQFEQVDWQMLCVRENQTFRTDAFGQAQYRLEQLRDAIQAESL